MEVAPRYTLLVNTVDIVNIIHNVETVDMVYSIDMVSLSNKSCFKSNKLRPILKCHLPFPKIFVLTCLDQSNQEKC